MCAPKNISLSNSHSNLISRPEPLYRLNDQSLPMDGCNVGVGARDLSALHPRGYARKIPTKTSFAQNNSSSSSSSLSRQPLHVLFTSFSSVVLLPNLTPSVFSLVTVAASNPSLVLHFPHEVRRLQYGYSIYRRLTDIILSSVTKAVIGYRKRVPVVFLSGTICIEDFARKIWVTPSSRVQRRVECVWFNLTRALGRC